MGDNYIGLAIEEVYEVIRSGSPWPREFNVSRKVNMLNGLINYFEGKEEFEKCAYLKQQIDELENPKSKIGSTRNN
jgi:protein-arginine kinase activator protein McsA